MLNLYTFVNSCTRDNNEIYLVNWFSHLFNLWETGWPPILYCYLIPIFQRLNGWWTKFWMMWELHHARPRPIPCIEPRKKYLSFKIQDIIMTSSQFASWRVSGTRLVPFFVQLMENFLAEKENLFNNDLPYLIPFLSITIINHFTS